MIKENPYVWFIPAYCPSRSEKDADAIARQWLSGDEPGARQAFNAFAVKHKFLDYEAVMFMDKVKQRKIVLERAPA